MAMPTYRLKKAPHAEHQMAQYPDGKYRFCRYYMCGYCERLDEMGAWAPGRPPSARRKPKDSVLLEALAIERPALFVDLPGSLVVRSRFTVTPPTSKQTSKQTSKHSRQSGRRAKASA